MDPLRLRRLEHNTLPQLWQLGHPGDAGIDLFCAESTVVQPDQFRDICLGVEIQLPAEFWGLLTGRSSTLRKHGLMVNQGIIDQGYRGRLFAGVFNLTDRPVPIAYGSRLAQLILLPLWARSPLDLAGSVIEVDQLEGSQRGQDGFGSTGT